MKCPKDGTELAPVKLAGVELDKCHHCDGIWLDHGELERIRAARMSEIEEELERQYGDPQFTAGKTDGYMVCPRCQARLQRIAGVYTKVVQVDRCESCQGIWMDDGEINALGAEHISVRLVDSDEETDDDEDAEDSSPAGQGRSRRSDSTARREAAQESKLAFVIRAVSRWWDAEHS